MLDRNRQPQLAGPGHGQALSADSYYDVPQNYGPYGRDYAGQDEGFNPLKLLLYIAQYRWLIVMMAAAGLVAGVIVTMMQTPKYQATTQLEVLVPSAKVFQDIEVVSENSDVRAFLTAREKLKGTFILLRIAEKENLTVGREELFQRVAVLAERYEMGFEQMLKELQKRGAIDQIQEEIVTAKALDFVVGHAIITESPLPKVEASEALETAAAELAAKASEEPPAAEPAS